MVSPNMARKMVVFPVPESPTKTILIIFHLFFSSFSTESSIGEKRISNSRVWAPMAIWSILRGLDLSDMARKKQHISNGFLITISFQLIILLGLESTRGYPKKPD